MTALPYPKDIDWICDNCKHPANTHQDDGRCLFAPGCIFMATTKRMGPHAPQGYDWNWAQRVQVRMQERE